MAHETIHPSELEGQSGKGFEAIHSLVERAKKLGIGTRFAVFAREYMIIGQGAEEPLFAASLGKLPLACMAIERLTSGEETRIPKELIDTAGGGVLDTMGDHIVTVDELLADMLGTSGNTAYRVLAELLGGPDAIREYYEQQWSNTTIHTAPNGRALIGETTVAESYAQLRSLLRVQTDELSPGDRWLRDAAAEALLNNTVTKHGIRQIVSPTHTLAILNKTGEYNGDLADPQSYRHDVGYVIGSPKESLGYAVMTTSSGGRMRRMVADWAVAQFGAEIARRVGGPDTTSLASRAIRAALLRP